MYLHEYNLILIASYLVLLLVTLITNKNAYSYLLIMTLLDQVNPSLITIIELSI